MEVKIKHKGETFYCEWVEETNFEDLENVKQASGFVFDTDGKVCLVKCHDFENWALPGGGPEPEDENYEETFIREVLEEIDIEIKDIKPLGYLKIYSEKKPDFLFIQLRYVANVSKINKQTIDPAKGEINQRKFVKVGEFFSHTKWEDKGIFQLEKAIEKIKGN